MNWTQFKDMMRACADEVAGIQYLTLGYNTEVAEAVKSERKYPALHVSFPRIRSRFDGNGLKESWNVQVCVGKSIPVGDNAAMDECHHETLILLRQVIAWLISASDDYRFELGNSVNIDVMDPHTSDNENGWFAEIELEFVTCLPY